MAQNPLVTKGPDSSRGNGKKSVSFFLQAFASGRHALEFGRLLPRGDSVGFATRFRQLARLRPMVLTALAGTPIIPQACKQGGGLCLELCSYFVVSDIAIRMSREEGVEALTGLRSRVEVL